MTTNKHPIRNLRDTADCEATLLDDQAWPSGQRLNVLAGHRGFAKHWMAATSACVVLVLSSVGFAQTVVTASASIPFDFWAQGQKFPAGEYVFDSGFPGSTSIRRKGSQSTVAISIIPYASPVKKENAEVVFNSRDGKYYLAEFWGVLDKRVVTAEFEHRGETNEQRRRVRLIYP
jgi:hypothetical protein